MFPKTVLEDRRLKSWKAIPIFFLSAESWEGDKRVRSVPWINTFPESGVSSRFTVRISVLFPAPEKPIIPTMSPSSTFKLILLSALKALFFYQMFWIYF